MDNRIKSRKGNEDDLVPDTSIKRMRIGELLVLNNVSTKAQIEIALRQQRVMREKGISMSIGRILVSMCFATQDAIEKVASQTSDNSHLSHIVERILPPEICNRFNVFPVRADATTLHLQSSRRLTDKEKKKIIDSCYLKNIQEIKIIAGDAKMISDEIKKHEDSSVSLDFWIRKLKKDVDGESLKGFLNDLIVEAEIMRASDIHLDCSDDFSSWVSYRIDGDIKQLHLIPLNVMRAVFTRIKTESGMDASESRRPQDGRMSIDLKTRKLDIRLASQPLAEGETITLRLLSQGNMKRIESLFDSQPKMLNYLGHITNFQGKSGGLVIVSGATGSGKSTTIYALAQEFDRDRINVMTVEDPVEYTLPFCRQIQINQLIEQRATDMERSLLRQDPDVIIFGELRDANFTQAALKLTESGHLCLSTIHAVDAFQTFERLQSVIGEALRADMMFVLSNYLKAVINQRLIKRLCSCSIQMTEQEIESKHAILNALELPLDYLPYKAVGCNRCNDTGYFGRIVAHESILIPDDDELRSKIRSKFSGEFDIKSIKSIPGIHYISRAQSLKPLVESGLVSLDIASATLGVYEL